MSASASGHEQILQCKRTRATRATRSTRPAPKLSARVARVPPDMCLVFRCSAVLDRPPRLPATSLPRAPASGSARAFLVPAAITALLATPSAGSIRARSVRASCHPPLCLNPQLDPCAGFRTGDWPCIHRAIRAFLDGYLAQLAADIGWTDLELFAVHREVGVARLDACGALMASRGVLVTQVTPQLNPLRQRTGRARAPGDRHGSSRWCPSRPRCRAGPEGQTRGAKVRSGCRSVCGLRTARLHNRKRPM